MCRSPGVIVTEPRDFGHLRGICLLREARGEVKAQAHDDEEGRARACRAAGVSAFAQFATRPGQAEVHEPHQGFGWRLFRFARNATGRRWMARHAPALTLRAFDGRALNQRWLEWRRWRMNEKQQANPAESKACARTYPR